MYKELYKKLCVLSFCFVFGCSRDAPAPVDIKIDDDGNFVGAYDNDLSSAVKEPVPNHTNNDVYRAKAGETIFDIANRYNIDPMNLARINGIEYPYRLKKGQALLLPNNNHGNDDVEETPEVTDIPNNENKKLEDNGAQDQKTQEKNEKDKRIDEGLADIIGAETAVNTAKPSLDGGKKIISSEKVDRKKEAPKDKKKEKSQSATSTPSKDSKVIASDSGSDVPKSKPASEWIAPVQGKIVSKYGDNVDGISNDGIDIKAQAGTPVKACKNGTVMFAGEGSGLDPSYGQTILIDHGNNVVSSYTHLGKINVKNGTKVNAGEVIGTVGKSGHVSEPMLHFEITKGTDAFPENPEKYIKF